METKVKIFEQVTNNPIVLYMKGTPQFPQCGFSAAAVEILRRCGVKKMLTVDVLMDPEIRRGVKEYANWPTVPQLYLGGEFVGGADILREMFDSGELQEQIKRHLPADGG